MEEEETEEKEKEVDKLLDKTLDDLKIEKSTDIVPAEDKKRKSKIELAGRKVMTHLVELVKNTDYSYTTMAKRINELYGLELTKSDVVYFFRTNQAIIDSMLEDRKTLNKFRADLFLEHNQVLSKDIQTLNKEIARLVGEESELLEADKRGKVVGDLIDKKGRLLMRQARLSGKLKDGFNVDKMQVNIFKQVSEEKSEILKRLKKADFKEEKKVVDVEANEVKKTNT